VDCIIWLGIRSGVDSCEQSSSVLGISKCGKFVLSLRLWLLVVDAHCGC
jgi:hypothetical protein